MISRLAAALAALTLLAAPIARADQLGFDEAPWVATWGAAGQLPLFDEPRIVENQTLREIVRISRGGEALRVRLSNALGKASLTIDAASVAVRADEAAVESRSLRPLKFSGASSITIPPGATALSDEVTLRVNDEADLAISLYLKQSTTASTVLSSSHQTSYVSTPGDFTASATLEPSGTYTSWYWLAGVDVRQPHAQAIVAFGDSITEGYGSDDNTNTRWSDFLFQRLLEAGDRRHSVVNMAISGNRLLNDEIGPNALSRLDRDLLTQSGAQVAILLEGINDIGFPVGAAEFLPPEIFSGEVSTEAIVFAYRQIAQRSHDAGLRVFIGTLLPIGGSDYATPDTEAKRQAVNAYIRDNKDFDGVIDFDKATRDPADTSKLLAAYDSGDHLHPNGAGYEAMANAIDLDQLRRPRRLRARSAAAQ